MLSYPRLLALVASSALAASVLAATASAGAADRPDFTKGADGPRTVATAPDTYASGVIVHTTDGTVSTSLRAKAEQLTSGAVTRSRAMFGKAHVLDFDKPVPAAVAQKVADELEKRADVVSAEPDRIMKALANESPVARNDPLFPYQFGVWDRRSVISQIGLTLPKGGYSARAPYLWRATAGKSTVRVAVIDTGITTHSELTGQTAGGYDFFTDPTEDRDGTPGRDADPSDPGDWTPSVNYCGVPEAGPADPATASSWHGTHVAGIVAAKANNSVGIVGIAAGARVQPIRVLGPCGGSTSDISDAIVWAAGGHIDGVPDNPLPSKVINLSLGGDVSTCEAAFQSAITEARVRGSVVVAAAGNGSDLDSIAPIGAPANCVGVIAVVASDEIGQATVYSSLGTTARKANIAAPGGDTADTAYGFHGIRSTMNAGTTVPGAQTYAYEQGTSMAAPAVSAGAALLSSLGYSRAEIESTLRYAVRSFPQYTGQISAFNCDTTTCGRGILDLSTVPAPYWTTRILGTMRQGYTIKAYSPWTGNPSLSYRWYRNGSRISNSTKSYYKLTSADRHKNITVRVYGTKYGFRTLWRASAARTVS
jgi:serine protease